MARRTRRTRRTGGSRPSRGAGRRGGPPPRRTAGRPLRTQRYAVVAQYVAEVEDEREHLVVVVLALLVPGALLGLDRHPVLGEDPLGETADERPGEMERPGDRRLRDREQAV